MRRYGENVCGEYSRDIAESHLYAAAPGKRKCRTDLPRPPPTSPDLPRSPHISPHLPTSPHISPAGFAAQLGLATEGGPPLFLHSRAARGEFAAMCKERRGAVGAAGGVVHSFDGDAAELEQLLSLDAEQRPATCVYLKDEVTSGSKYSLHYSTGSHPPTAY